MDTYSLLKDFLHASSGEVVAIVPLHATEGYRGQVDGGGVAIERHLHHNGAMVGSIGGVDLLAALQGLDSPARIAGDVVDKAALC